MKRSHLIALAALVALSAAAPWIGPLQSGEAEAIDLRFRWRGPRKVASKVVVVAVDDATERQWAAIPKGFWAGGISQLVAKARDAGAKRIGVDFVFSVDADAFLQSVGSNETPIADLDLVVSQSPDKIALGTRDGDDNILPLGDPTDGRRFFSLNGLQSDLKVVRELPRWDDSLSPPVMGLAAGLAQGKAEVGGPVAINYSGGGIPTLSGAELLNGSVDKGILNDAVVLIGETYGQSQDRYDTPFAESTPGVLIQAEAAATILDGRELRAPARTLEAALLALLAFLAGIVALRTSALRFLAVGTAFAAGWGATAYAAFTYDFVLPVVGPLVTLAIVPLVIFPIRATEERIERLWLRSQLGQMVSDEFAKRLEAQRDAKLGTLGSFNAALMFLDVVGFSKRSNEQSQERLVQELNEVFGLVVEHVQAQGGTVLNFIGDGLFAMFDDDGTGVDRSLRAANAILTDKRAGGFPLRIGMALGEVSLALVGSSERKQMTVYGSAVNLASRLEQAGKELGASLVASSHYAGWPGLTGATIEVKGWDDPIVVYFRPN